jgi:hypothetical protein
MIAPPYLSSPHPIPGGGPTSILPAPGAGEIDFWVVVDGWGGCG